jgi:hypothetical protein
MIVLLNGLSLTFFKWSAAISDDTATSLAFLIVTSKIFGQNLL